ncbi:MAG: hypothetical protein ACP5PP_05945 [Fervidobacterium sp.]
MAKMCMFISSTFLTYMYDTAFRRIDPSYATTVAIATALVSHGIVMLLKMHRGQFIDLDSCSLI